MATETTVIPDLYFHEDDQELQTSSVEGKGEHGQGGGLEGGKTVDLTPEGFIPIHKLTLGELPEPIRTEKHLQYILGVSKNVVLINNNSLSDKRPDDDQFKKNKQKTLSGSGLLRQEARNLLGITTNRHVLFNEEELHNASFDIFYDYHHGDPDDKEKRVQRCGRRKGKFFSGKFSKNDLASAIFEVNDVKIAQMMEQCLDEYEASTRYLKLDQPPALAGDPTKPPVACLISHPMGQPKHVSFGEMVDYNMQSRTVHHTAPSKPGSSGGLVIVFAKSRIPHYIIHVGTDRQTRNKFASVHYSDKSLLDAFDCLPALPSEAGHTPDKEETTLEDNAQEASASLEIASLDAFAPMFGAFLLHTEETRLAGLDTSVLKPCKPFLTDDSLTFPDLKQSVKEAIETLARVAPSFSVCLSKNLDDTPDLVSLLESRGPCFCQSIVKMMERGVTLEDGTVTECYLSPYTSAAKMSSDSDVTWLWLNRSRPDLRNDGTQEECLLKKCWQLCNREIIPVILLLMITKANIDVQELCFQTCDASSTKNHDDSAGQWETINVRTTQVHPREQSAVKRPGKTRDSPPLAREEKLKSSIAEVDGDGHILTEDVLTFVHCALGSVMDRFATKFLIEHQAACSQDEGDDLTILYSRCLALSEHAWQHERQIHPDIERDGREDSSENWCHCGRPGLREVVEARDKLELRTRPPSATDIYPSHAQIREAEDILDELQDKIDADAKSFRNFLGFLEQVASEQSLPSGTSILAVLDTMDAFPHGRHSLMLYLASGEAFLYNDCLLARHISKSLLPWYYAFPVSVFGRPGNWPGNVTPPEVQRTAWRLVQDAIMASGFPPAVLSALEEDADRQTKLIDLYVDMKQLKWKGRIQPHLFELYLADSKWHMFDHLQSKTPFYNSTHYTVWYAAFLVCPKIITS